jgi:hypothetical protein
MMAQQKVPKRYSTVLRRLMRAGVCPAYEEWDAEDRNYDTLFERAWNYPALEAEIIDATAAYWSWKQALRAHQPEEVLRDEFDRRYDAFYQAATEVLKVQNPVRRTKVDDARRERVERPRSSDARHRAKPRTKSGRQLGHGLAVLQLNLDLGESGRGPFGRGLEALGFDVAPGEED